MSKIRITSVPLTNLELRPDWVGEAMVGATISICGSLSDSSSYAVEGGAIEHGLRYYGEHADAKKASDWWLMYLKFLEARTGTKNPIFFFVADCCEYIP